MAQTKKELDAIIEKIGKQRQAGDYGMVQDMAIREKVLRGTYTVGVFLNDKEFTFKVGDEIHIALGKPREYKGKNSYPASIDDIVLLSPASPDPIVGRASSTPTPTKEVDWDGKEKRDYKGRCMMYSLEVLKMTHADFTTKTPDEVRETAQNLANAFVKWIYD